MTAASDAFGAEGIDQLRELAEREPVDADGGIGGGAGVDLGRGLFLDGGDDNGEAMCARGVQQQEREAAIAGDEAKAVRTVLDLEVFRGMEVPPLPPLCRSVTESVICGNTVANDWKKMA